MCKVFFMSNPTSGEVELGRVDVVVGVVTIETSIGIYPNQLML